MSSVSNANVLKYFRVIRAIDFYKHFHLFEPFIIYMPVFSTLATKHKGNPKIYRMITFAT